MKIKNLITSIAFIGISLMSVQAQKTNIKGTKFVMASPGEDFTLYYQPFYGYVNKSYDAIITLSSSRISELSEYDLAANVLMKDKVMLEDKEITISDLPAKYRKVRGITTFNDRTQGTTYKEEAYIYEIIFDDGEMRNFLYALFPVAKEQLYKDRIENTILGLEYLKDTKVDILDKLPFKIKIDRGLFIPTFASQDLLLTDGTDNGAWENPSYKISRFLYSEVTEKEMADGNAIMNDDLSAPSIFDKKLRYYEINGFKVTEVIAYQQITREKKRVIYTAVFRNNKNLYKIKGYAVDKYDYYIFLFREMSESIKEND